MQMIMCLSRTPTTGSWEEPMSGCTEQQGIGLYPRQHEEKRTQTLKFLLFFGLLHRLHMPICGIYGNSIHNAYKVPKGNGYERETKYT